jgi:RHS repeat-associated protein
VTGTFVGDFGFAGEQMDDSGLSYNRARYYNPSLGAFTALDPFEGLEERPMSMNGYSYAENNPANWTDPSGEFADGFAISQGLGLSPMIKGLVDLIVAGLGSLVSTKILIVLAAALLLVAVASIIHVAIQGTKLVCITCNGVQVIDLLNNNPGVIDPAPDIDTDEFTPYTQREIEQALAPMGNPNSQPTPISTVFPVPNSTPFVITPTPSRETNVLVLGESPSFRYATDLAVLHPDWNIVGTKYGSGSNTQIPISRISNLTLVDDVDGTKLESGNFTSNQRFTAVVFNAPRSGTGWRRESGDLVEGVLASSGMCQ